MHQLAADNLDVPTLNHQLSPIDSDEDEDDHGDSDTSLPKPRRKGKRGKKTP